VVKFLLHIDKFGLQSTPNWCARLQTASPQAQKTPYLAQFESQALYAANESQSFDFSFTKLPEASLRSLRSQNRMASGVSPVLFGTLPMCMA